MSAVLVYRVLAAILLHSLNGELLAGGDDQRVRVSPLSKREVEVCTTPGCQEISENLRKKVNFKENPCQNFYQFTCGRYREGKSEQGVNTDTITEQITDLLILEPRKYPAFTMAKNMFFACAIHNTEIKALKKLIADIGGWSLLDPNVNEAKFSLDNFYKNSIANNYIPKPVVKLMVRPRPARPSERCISVEQNAELMFPPNYDATHPIVKAIADKLNINYDNAAPDFLRYEKIAKGIAAIAKKWVPSGGGGVRYKPFKDLPTLYPHLALQSLIREMIRPTEIPDTDIISIYYPKLMTALDEYIGGLSPGDLHSYVMWFMVLRLSPNIDEQIFEAATNIQSKGGTAVEVQKYCALQTADLFRRVIDYEYVEKYYDKTLKTSFSHLPGIIGVQMNFTISDSAFNPDAKKKMLAKVNNIRWHIGYDEEIDTKEQVEKYYEDLEVRLEHHLLSLLNISRFTRLKEFNVPLSTPYKPPYFSITKDRYKFVRQNYVYYGATNMMGILNPYGKPLYWIMGTVGFYIAHTMHHTLDRRGINHDENGAYNENWLDDDTKKELLSANDCIVKQYSGMQESLVKTKFDGSTHDREHFCDNGGVQLAHKAYTDMLDSGDIPDKVLPDFKNYTLRQMFWISFASIHCERLPNQQVAAEVINGTYRSAEIRVNGALMNTKGFADDFECDSEARMTREEKCLIWKRGKKPAG